MDLKRVTEIDFTIKQITADPFKGKTRNNINHICISNKLLHKMQHYEVGAWNNFTEKGRFMSDHNGVYIEFEIE